MKYTELHAHIEGTVTVKTLVTLIIKYKDSSIILPDYFSDYQKETIKNLYTLINNHSVIQELEKYLYDRLVLNSPTKTLIEFLKRVPSKFLRYYIRSRDDLVFVIETTLAQYGTDYDRIELIFIPKSLENEWIKDDEIVKTFSDVWKKSARKEKIGFVLSLRRTGIDVSPENCFKIIDRYSKYVNVGISKLDICADENAISYTELRESLDILKNAKQNLTLHIGETTSRDMNFVLDNYPMVKQFNHGIQGAFDKNILSKLKRNDVLLTICPLSNIYTGVLTEEQVIAAIRTFKNYKIRYTINSDDSTIINGDVYAPYKYLLNKAPELLV
ncbi:MAG: hypothetical protein WCT77_09970 [Bacteroidota bacterium]